MHRIALALALISPVAAWAQKPVVAPPCTIKYDAQNDLGETIKAEGFAFDEYDALCERLDREGLGISVISGAGVLQERAFGWASVTVYRRSSLIHSTLSRATTTLGRTADTPEAKLLAFQSLNGVLRDIARDPEPFVRSVTQEEARLRRVLSPTPLPRALSGHRQLRGLLVLHDLPHFMFQPAIG